MKLIIAAVLTASCVAVAMPAAAASQWVGSVEYQQLDFSKGGPNPGLVAGQLSYRSSQYWGVEAEASTGVVKNQNTNVGDEIAAYATATLPVGGQFDLFARGGYGWLSVNAAGTRLNANYWAYGVGADAWLSKGWGVRADYTRQVFNKSIVPDANVYALGIAHKF